MCARTTRSPSSTPARVLPDVDYRPDPYSALDGADALLLATEWEEYGALDWALVRETMRGKTVLDGRNALDGVSLPSWGSVIGRSAGRRKTTGTARRRMTTRSVARRCGRTPQATGTVWLRTVDANWYAPGFGKRACNGDQSSVRRTAARAGKTRVEVRGKFLFANGEKLYLRGVTYGTFRPQRGWDDVSGARDRRGGLPGRWWRRTSTPSARIRFLLPGCWTSRLRSGFTFSSGIPWEQHITFLDDRKTRKRIEGAVRDAVRSCAGHPAVLAYLIGNEIPAPIVRWYGRRRIEAWLRRLYRVAKREDPDALVTYVNYPTTEYLDLSFLDFVCFNVYLETREQPAVISRAPPEPRR